MDNEMIERAARAAAKIDQPTRDYISFNESGKKYYRDLTIEIIKAMREPTEKMNEAALNVGPDRSPNEYWEAYIDSILND